MRLYGVSKSYLPFGVSKTPLTPAAPVSVAALGPTAPTSAVIPAFLRNDLRLKPACCDMLCSLVFVIASDTDRNRLILHPPTSKVESFGSIMRAIALSHEGRNHALHLARACVRRRRSHSSSRPVRQQPAIPHGKIRDRLADVPSRPCRERVFAAHANRLEECRKADQGLDLQPAERRAPRRSSNGKRRRGWTEFRSDAHRRQSRDVSARSEPRGRARAGGRQGNLAIYGHRRYTFAARGRLLARRRQQRAAHHLHRSAPADGARRQGRHYRSKLRQQRRS